MKADTSNLDQLYSYDDVNRLVQSEEGTLSAGKDSISSLNFKQQWSLDATGNWSAFKEDLGGDATWDLQQTRTSSAVNEITDITEASGPSWATPVYNRAGNMTTIPQPGDPTQSYAATYDAWNRLVKLEEGEDTVAEYVFDGAKRLVVRKKYASGSLSQIRHFYHTAGWQTIEERLESGGNILSTADRQFTWGRRYIDDLVCRTVNSVHDYAYQDPNWNVILSSTALARVVYQPYGQIRSTCPAAQGDLDGWQHYFAGYRRDEDTRLYLVRHRVYQPELGCWVQRDPIGYRSSVTLYEYAISTPCAYVDPFGTSPVTLPGVYWTLRIGALVAGTPATISWGHSHADASFNEIKGTTDRGEVNNTVFSGDPTETAKKKRKCPVGGGSFRVCKIRFARLWPWNSHRQIVINARWHFAGGSLSGSLNTAGTSGTAPGVGYRVIGITLSAYRTEYPCECHKYVPCVSGSVTIRVVVDEPWPSNNIDADVTCSFDVCADGTQATSFKTGGSS